MATATVRGSYVVRSRNRKFCVVLVLMGLNLGYRMASTHTPHIGTNCADLLV